MSENFLSIIEIIASGGRARGEPPEQSPGGKYHEVIPAQLIRPVMRPSRAVYALDHFSWRE